MSLAFLLAFDLAFGFQFHLCFAFGCLLLASIVLRLHLPDRTTLLAPRFDQLFADRDHFLDRRIPIERAPRRHDRLLQDVGRVFQCGEVELHRFAELLGVLNGWGNFQRSPQSCDGHGDLTRVSRLEARLDFALERGQCVQRNERRIGIDRWD